MLPAVQLAETFELEEAQVHAVQVRPSPKYPALHTHVDVSVVVLPRHTPAFVAYGEHVLHAEQVVPSP